jgi:hypothetical protein
VAPRSRLTGGGLRFTLQQTITACWCAHSSRAARSLCASCGQRRTLCALIGCGIDRQLQRVGCTPSPRANLVLWHMHVPLPWHMHLCLRMIDRCRVTRPDQPTATRRFFPLPRTGDRQGVSLRFCDRPHYFTTIRFVHSACYLPWHLHTITSRSLGDEKLVPKHRHSGGNRPPSFPPHHMHAFRRAIPGFYCFWVSNSSRI